MSPTRRADRLESALKHADAKLEDWFRRGQKTTRRASVRFAGFLRRAKRQSAGALRHQVEDLQGGLKKISARLAHVEREGAAISKKAPARPDGARKPAASTKASPRRKRKKAA